MEKNELEKNVQQHIVMADNNFFEISKKEGYSVYGDIALAIEENKSQINGLAEAAGNYLAFQKAAKITHEYEQDCSVWEKYIKDNPLKKREMELRRKSTIHIVSTTAQVVVKSGVTLAQKLLASRDCKVAKNSIWNLAYRYANEITGQDIAKFKAVNGKMFSLYFNLFQKEATGSLADTYDGKIHFPKGVAQRENMASVLYMIYIAKHMHQSQYQDKEQDKDILFDQWAKFGIEGADASILFNKLNDIEQAEGDAGIKLCEALQGIYQNLMISIPNINKEQAQSINREFLQYVPNGDKKMLARTAVNMVEKSIILGEGTLLSGSPVAHILVETAASAALSMFENTSDRTLIGNVLEDSGISSSAVSKCMDEANKMQKQIRPAVSGSK